MVLAYGRLRWGGGLLQTRGESGLRCQIQASQGIPSMFQIDNENTVTKGAERSSHLTESLHGISTVLQPEGGSSDLDMKPGDDYLMIPSH